MKSILFFLSLGLALLGCAESTTSSDSGTADSGTSDSGNADSGNIDSGNADSGNADSSRRDVQLTPLAFEVEFVGPAGPVVLEDGVVVEWHWGFQGGSMITPRIFFEEGSVQVDQVVQVILSHAPDPSAPDAYGEVADFPGATLGLRVASDEAGRLSVGPIEDQLGWSDLNGTRLVLSVEVQRGEESATRSGAISLLIAAGPCDVFEQPGEGGCSYYQIPGSAVVSLGAIEEGRCTDARPVGLAFTPDAGACATDRGWQLPETFSFTVGGGDAPPSRCLDDIGLTDGATVRGTALLIANGTCSPTGFELEDDDGSCSELCNAP